MYINITQKSATVGRWLTNHPQRNPAVRCTDLLGFMTINQLIKRLEELRETAGDAAVEVRNPAGDFDEASEAQLVNVSRKSGETKWRVYVEA